MQRNKSTLRRLDTDANSELRVYKIAHLPCIEMHALHIQNPYRVTIADIIFREGGADITVKLRYFSVAAILGGLSD